MITALVVIVKLLLYVGIGHGVYRGWLAFSPPSDKNGRTIVHKDGREIYIEYHDWGTTSYPNYDWHTNIFGLARSQRWSVISLFWWAHIGWPILLLVTGVILAGRGTAHTAITLNDLTIKQINNRVNKQCKELPPEPAAPPKDEFELEAEREVEELLNAS